MARVALREIGVPPAAGAAVFVVFLAVGTEVANALFVAVLTTGLVLVLGLAWSGHREARRQGIRAAELRAASAAEVARVAVDAERERLARDIEARLSDLLGDVRARAERAAAAVDPRPDLVDIQHAAQRAMTELRRQLGLLRPVGRPERAIATDPGPGRALGAGDVVLALLAATLACAESLTYASLERTGPDPTAVALAAVAALSVLGRRTAPVRSALVFVVVAAAGAVSGHHLSDGFWFPLVTGLLLWALVQSGTRAGWMAVALLVTVALGSRLLHVPENAGINAVCLAVALVAALAVARSRRLQAAARVEAAERTEELQAASEDAVRAERFVVARELHDSVSNAVSVIAVQAGAAEMLWPVDQAAARAAIDVIERTALGAAQDLDRLLPGHEPATRTGQDVSDLLARMRSAGLTIRADDDARTPDDLMPTVYRVVQETLTNALRHAPQGTVHVAISTDSTGGGGATTVRVTTQGSSAGASVRPGYGLVGLGERMAELGGRLEVSRDSLDRFTVVAVLPRSPATDPR